MELTARHCTPCRGGVAPLTQTAAEARLPEVPGWQLADGVKRLVRCIHQPDFAAALVLVNRIGALAEQEGHHPDIKFGWGYVTVELFTHKIGGLHENDFILAAKINALAPPDSDRH